MSAPNDGRLSLGWKVFGGLALLTLLEYFVAVEMAGSLSLLGIIALGKAGLILQYFMHVAQLWREDEGGH